MRVVNHRLLLVLVVQAVSTSGSYEPVATRPNLTDRDGTSTSEDTPSLDGSLRSTVCTVFDNLDEIFKRLLDFPMFYSVPKPVFKTVYKTYDDGPSGSLAGPSGTSKSTAESEGSRLEYGFPSSTESNDEKVGNGLTSDPITGDIGLGPAAKRWTRSRRTVDWDEVDQEDRPHVVFIGNKVDKAWKRTGVALSPFLVLTAASGLVDSQARLYRPDQLSVFSPLPNASGSVEMAVVNLLLRPQSAAPRAAQDEIALLEVLNLNDTQRSYPSLAQVDTATLPTNCWVFGWNVADKHLDEPGRETPRLRKMSVILSDADKCKQTKPEFNESVSYCWASSDAPHGYMDELGAPLICSGQVVGLVAGTANKTKGLDVFTRVSQHYSFVQESKKRSWKRFAKETWRAKQLYDVQSSAAKLTRCDEVMTSVLTVVTVVGLYYLHW